MALKFFNRVYVLTASTGTAAVNLGAAISSNLYSFSDVGAVDGDNVYYAIEEGTDIEIGIGTIGGGGTSLSRDTVYSSKIGGVMGTSKINLTGAGRVRVIEPAEFIDLIVDHMNATDNPHGVTKAQVGLGNADNTSDANKPVSSAQQSALDAKLDIADDSIRGAQQASPDGVANWNDSTNILPGRIQNRLMNGADTNGPGGTLDYHTWVGQYADTEDLWQIAYPAEVGGNLWQRVRTGSPSTWSSWRKIAFHDEQFANSVSAKAANYTVVAADNGRVITVDASGAARTVTLPPVATAGAGFKLVVKKTDVSANTVTIDGDGAETIDDAETMVLRLHNQSVALVCDGAAWHVMAEGSVFESGSNANGGYTRFASGLQLCRSPNLTIVHLSSARLGVIWTFPSEFAGSYTVSMSLTSLGTLALGKQEGIFLTDTEATSSARVSLINDGDFVSGDSAVMRAFAMGEWF